MSAHRSFLLSALCTLPALASDNDAARMAHHRRVAHHQSQPMHKTMFAFGANVGRLGGGPPHPAPQSPVEVDLNLSLVPNLWGFNESLTDIAKGSYAVLSQVSAHSWEWGTQTEVAVELFYPQLGVFSQKCPYPLSCGNWDKVKASSKNGKDVTVPVPSELFYVVDPVLATHTPPSNHTPQPIVDGDGASGDPASMGVACLLCGATNTSQSAYYDVPAQDQLEYLLTEVPRNWDDGISQRDAQVQFWSDNAYMAPPFLAYYGALQANLSLLSLAHQQYAAYRNVLMDNTTGLWRHILLGNTTDGGTHDAGFWSTGEGWAAAGMLRVLATLAHVPASLKAATIPMRRDLHAWAAEILAGVWAQQDAATGLLPNYYRAPENQSSAYLECSGTAMLSAASFRLASLTGDARFVPQATYAMWNMLERNINSTYALAPVVNPLGGWSDPAPFAPGGVSPEGQAFVVAMIAAWRDLQEGNWGWAME